MKISERSWHLRLMRFVWNERGNRGPGDWYEKYTPRDLCGYFWRLMLTIGIPALGVPTLLFLIGWFVKENWRALLVIFIVMVVTAACSGIIWFLVKGFQRAQSWSKAKKAKFCPLIEVVQ